jgi:hypothetical protein
VITIKDNDSTSAIDFPCPSGASKMSIGTEVQIKYRRSPGFMVNEDEVWDARTADKVFVSYDAQKHRSESLWWLRALGIVLFAGIAAICGRFLLRAWREQGSPPR